MKKVHWERSKLFLEVNFSVEKWAETFVFDAILKLKTDEERSLGATKKILRSIFLSKNSTQTFVSDAVLKLKTDEKRSLGTSILFRSFFFFSKNRD